MIPTAYMDESGTHGGDGAKNPASEYLVMAGMMANARQWRHFQQEINGFKSKYGFNIFHAKKFKHRQGEFKGWPNQKCISFVSEFNDLIAQNLMEGCGVVLNRTEYLLSYRSDPIHKKVHLDTEYGLCFRACIKHLTQEAFRRLGSHKKFAETRLNVILEQGAKNCEDARRVFFEMREGYKKAGLNLLDTFTLAEKTDCDPLMTADFLAHSFWSENPDHWHRQDAKPDEKQTTGLTHLGFSPEALREVRAIHDHKSRPHIPLSIEISPDPFVALLRSRQKVTP